MKPQFKRFVRWTMQSRRREYWTFQAVGWSMLFLLNYISLNIWYTPGQFLPVLHAAFQSVLGVFLTLPIGFVARRYWQAPTLRRIAVVGLATLTGALVWVLIRTPAFTWMTGEHILAADWGGWIYTSVVVFGGWTFCYHAIRYNRQWNDEHQAALSARAETLKAWALTEEANAKRLEAESAAKDAQLQLLRHQLSPHFLFNALNSVTALVARKKLPEAESMLAQIAQFLRLSLDFDDDRPHTLRDEMGLVENYLSIEKIRYGDRLSTELDIEPSALDCQIPAFLLQPLFENSIKHGVGSSLETTTISLTARVEGGRLAVTVADNAAAPPRTAGGDGVGFGLGIGLQNVERRLRSTFDEDFRFRPRSTTPCGFATEIEMPARALSQVISARARRLPTETPPGTSAAEDAEREGAEHP